MKKIIMYTQNRSRIVKEVLLDSNGNYRAELSPGTYLIDINHLGIDSSSEVPKVITIEANRTVKLDIDIDTGIR